MNLPLKHTNTEIFALLWDKTPLFGILSKKDKNPLRGSKLRKKDTRSENCSIQIWLQIFTIFVSRTFHSLTVFSRDAPVSDGSDNGCRLFFRFISFFQNSNFRNLVTTYWWREIESFTSQTLGSKLNQSLLYQLVSYFTL